MVIPCVFNRVEFLFIAAKWRFFLAAALGAQSFSVAPAWAGPQHQCTKYAKEAMSQIKTSYEHKCGFAGPRWVYNEAAHHFWCIQPDTTIAMISGEDKARKNALDACIGKTNVTRTPDQKPKFKRPCSGDGPLKNIKPYTR